MYKIKRNNQILQLANVLEKQKVNKVTTTSSIVNTAIELAENLGGYVGGSRRFNLQKNDNADVDIFFTDDDAYGVFCKYLTFVGKQNIETEDIYVDEKKYTSVKKKFSHQVSRLVKGSYSVDTMKLDISCVEEILDPKKEINNYAEKIVDQRYDDRGIKKK